MFDSVVDARGALDALVDVRRERIHRECEELVLVGRYADTCPPPEGEEGRSYGSAGTPAVAEFAACELGAVLATTTSAAATLIGDVLDLRHRLPRLWTQVEAGVVPAWKARAVARATRELSRTAAFEVDESVAGLIGRLAWPRFETKLDAAVIAADPVGAEHRAAAWAADRFVRLGRTGGHGYKLLIARAAAGDVIWFDAMVSRIAEILHQRGDTDPAQVRRSKAIGILAQPTLALSLLTEHQLDAPDQAMSAEPDAPAPEHHQPEQPQPDQDQPYPSVRLPRPDSPLGQIDPAAVAPKVVLHVHLTRDALTTGTGVARIEGVGPVTVSEVQRFLGTRHVRIQVRPVFDPAAVSPVDAYEIPDRIAEAVRLRNPVEVFPFGTQPARTPFGSADLDHTISYLALARGGPPGQTRAGNLGPLSRHHHRAKTVGGWSVRQPEAGRFVWRSPHGQVFTVDPTGTQHLGSGSYACAVWRAVRALTESQVGAEAEPHRDLAAQARAAESPRDVAGSNRDDVRARDHVRARDDDAIWSWAGRVRRPELAYAHST